jgi:HlyD family secretion protein
MMDIRRFLTKKRLTWGGAALVVLLLLALAMRTEPPEVDTATVQRGTLETTIDAEGVTRVRDRYVITAPTTGRLERIALRPGDAVSAGDLVAQLTPVPLDAQTLIQAQARIAAALALQQEAESRAAQTRDALRQAERNADRIHTVAQAGAVTAEAVEQADLQLALARRDGDAAAARVRSAGAELAAARATLLGTGSMAGSATAVRSPAGGRVLQLAEPSERVVAAGTPLLYIGDAAVLEIVLDILSTEAVRVTQGALVRIVEWGGPDTVEARVRIIEPAGFTRISALGVEEQRVNVIAELLNPPVALGDGYQVQARIITWQGADVLKVPNSALFRNGTAWQVFVLENGRARLRPVEPGRRGGWETEVIAGLEAGERVIVFPSDRVVDGARVRAMQR